VVGRERHLFAALSNAWAADGILVQVAAGAATEQSRFTCSNVSTPRLSQLSAINACLIVLGENKPGRKVD